MLKLIVFDCDGVMFDSKNANIMYYNSILSNFNHPKMTAEEESYIHMSSVGDSLKHIFRDYHQTTDEVVQYCRGIGYAPFLQYMKMEEDLIPFLEIVRKSCKLAISTNRTNTMVPLLQRYNLEGYFQKVVTAATAKRPKPAPDGLLEIMEYFTCLPEETLFIGDSTVDEQHAASAGIDLIAFKNRELKAKYHVNSFLEILKLPPFCMTG